MTAKLPHASSGRKPRVAYVSTYPPRECGIANFTQDLVEAIDRLHEFSPPMIIAVNERGASYNYGRLVKFQIERDLVESYTEAAHFINRSEADLVNLQHEFGLFGGERGEHIIAFLKELKKPIVTTLHTILLDPAPAVWRRVEELAHYSASVIVLAKMATQILEEGYGIQREQIKFIPHGCPDVPFVQSNRPKAALGLRDKILLSTFGLIHSGKGIQYAIRALPPIVKREPRIFYLVIGETHPEVRKIEGERYRNSLTDLVEELGLEKNVEFHNRYLKRRELIRYLQATDICIFPYVGKNQIASGTLTYALGAGKAMISTPFLHAEEILAEGCALRCEFRDPASIINCIDKLLKDDELRRSLEKKAYNYGREMTWPKVASKHIELFSRILKA